MRLRSTIPLTERHLQVGGDVTVLEELARAGVLGLLLPGVDGQVAGLYLFTAAFGRTVRDGLQEAARSAGAEFVFASGDNIRALLRG